MRKEIKFSKNINNLKIIECRGYNLKTITDKGVFVPSNVDDRKIEAAVKFTPNKYNGGR